MIKWKRKVCVCRCFHHSFDMVHGWWLDVWFGDGFLNVSPFPHHIQVKCIFPFHCRKIVSLSILLCVFWLFVCLFVCIPSIACRFRTVGWAKQFLFSIIFIALLHDECRCRWGEGDKVDRSRKFIVYASILFLSHFIIIIFLLFKIENCDIIISPKHQPSRVCVYIGSVGEGFRLPWRMGNGRFIYAFSSSYFWMVTKLNWNAMNWRKGMRELNGIFFLKPLLCLLFVSFGCMMLAVRPARSAIITRTFHPSHGFRCKIDEKFIFPSPNLYNKKTTLPFIVKRK